MSILFWIELLVVLAVIFIGARFNGVGLGIWGGVGLFLITVLFGVNPTSPPVDVLLIILAVVTAAATMDASGGIDYAGKKDVSNKPNNFGGGGGTGVSVTPVAFLVVNKDGDVSVLNVNSSAASTAAPADAVSQVVGFLERSPDLLERIKGVFSKKGEENKI